MIIPDASPMTTEQAAWLAGIHDIGKATPAVAIQSAPHADRMRDHGLTYNIPLIKADRRLAPHAARSSAATAYLS